MTGAEVGTQLVDKLRDTYGGAYLVGVLTELADAVREARADAQAALLDAGFAAAERAGDQPDLAYLSVQTRLTVPAVRRQYLTWRKAMAQGSRETAAS